MRNVSIAFFDTKPYDTTFFSKANEQYNFSINYLEPRLNEKTALLAKGAEIVCAFVNDRITAETVQVLKELGVKLIALRCAGYNNVDLQAVWNSIHVVRVPAYSPHSVAEFAVSLLMTLTRKTHLAYNRTRDGNFRLDGLTGRDLYGRTAGIIGTGKIGKIMAKILGGYGMNVLLFDAFPDTEWAKEHSFSYVQPDALFAAADVISLHCPLNADTYHLVNDHAFSLMKKDAVIINTGRGALIDTKALVEALKDQKIGGAALDVYEEEDNYFYEDWSQAVIQDDTLARLLVMPNVIVSSHQAFLTSDALTAIAETTLQNILEFIDNVPLTNEVCYKCTEIPCKKKKNENCF